MNKLFKTTELTMLKQATKMQMMSFGIYNKETLIIVDGGTPDDKDKLLSYIKSKGGVVDAWLITHGHYDHVGALEKILEDNDDIVIKKIFVDMFEFDKVKETLSDYEKEVYVKFQEQLSKLKKDMIVIPELFKKYKIGNYEIEILKELGTFLTNNFNDTGIVYKLYTETEPILFLGDLGSDGGDYILDTYKKEDLEKFRVNICQLAHHGQNGVKENFYDLINPKIALWPTPIWLFENNIGEGYNTGPYNTIKTIELMKKYGTINVTSFDSDAVLI